MPTIGFPVYVIGFQQIDARSLSTFEGRDSTQIRDALRILSVLRDLCGSIPCLGFDHP